MSQKLFLVECAAWLSRPVTNWSIMRKRVTKVILVITVTRHSPQLGIEIDMSIRFTGSLWSGWAATSFGWRAAYTRGRKAELHSSVWEKAVAFRHLTRSDWHSMNVASIKVLPGGHISAQVAKRNSTKNTIICVTQLAASSIRKSVLELFQWSRTPLKSK